MGATKGNGSHVRTQPAQFSLVCGTDLRCPNCDSTDLKKVSLAYQEGLFHTDAHTRLRAVVVGGTGPDLVIGKATTRGFHQSVVSTQLSPPVKWSYRKLILWWALVFFSIGWIIFYTNTFAGNSSAVLSPPLIRFSLLSAATRSYCCWFSSGGIIPFTHKRRYSLSGNARFSANAVAL